MADVATLPTPVPPVPPALFQKRKDGFELYALGLLVALVLHGAAGVGALNAPRLKQVVRIEMTTVKKVKPPPPPPPPEEKKPEPPKPKEPPPKKVAKAPPPEQAPPPPNSTPPPEPPPKPVPVVSGLTLESTVAGPGPAFAVGNTLYDDPNKNKLKPKDVQKYGGPTTQAPAPQTGGTADKGVFKPVPKFQISTEPEVSREVKPPYPADAKRDGIEGVVELRVEIWQDGTVRSVKVVRPLNPSLDAAAVEAMKKYVFKPATVDGKPVQYTIPRYVFRWELQS